MKNGIYPTMLTPYKNREIDYDTVRNLALWYEKNGCNGIFAVCQSSEMVYLSLKEKIKLATTVLDAVGDRLTVVASGHTSDSLEAQAEEINAMAETGVEAVVLVSNRFDPHFDGDRVWLSTAEKLLSMIKSDISLGIYECPVPYKRLLTPEILNWCKDTGRFNFIKDTCCDPVMLKQRLELLKGSRIGLFNANEQTFLHSLKHGGAGYSGIMANYHPYILSWIYNNFETQKDKAEKVSSILSMMAFTECNTYPCAAKYYLNKYEGISMETFARSGDEKTITPYWELILEQMHDLNTDLRSWL